MIYESFLCLSVYAFVQWYMLRYDMLPRVRVCLTMIFSTVVSRVLLQNASSGLTPPIIVKLFKFHLLKTCLMCTDAI